jgi:hypothetical protein
MLKVQKAIKKGVTKGSNPENSSFGTRKIQWFQILAKKLLSGVLVNFSIPETVPSVNGDAYRAFVFSFTSKYYRKPKWWSGIGVSVRIHSYLHDNRIFLPVVVSTPSLTNGFIVSLICYVQVFAVASMCDCVNFPALVHARPYRKHLLVFAVVHPHHVFRCADAEGNPAVRASCTYSAGFWVQTIPWSDTYHVSSSDYRITAGKAPVHCQF